MQGDEADEEIRAHGMVHADAIIADYGSKCKIKKNRWELEWRWGTSTKWHK